MHKEQQVCSKIYLCVVALGQVADEPVRVCRCGRCLDLLFACPLAAHGNVFSNGGGKECWLLGHQADLLV